MVVKTLRRYHRARRRRVAMTSVGSSREKGIDFSRAQVITDCRARSVSQGNGNNGTLIIPVIWDTRRAALRLIEFHARERFNSDCNRNT